MWFIVNHALRASVGEEIYCDVHLHFPGAVACHRYRVRSADFAVRVDGARNGDVRSCFKPFAFAEVVVARVGGSKAFFRPKLCSPSICPLNGSACPPPPCLQHPRVCQEPGGVDERGAGALTGPRTRQPLQHSVRGVAGFGRQAGGKRWRTAGT